MKNGECPKCGSREVRVVEGNRFELGIRVGLLSAAFLNAYVCVGCGYVELYVEDAEDLPKIASRWPKVNG